MSEKEDKNFDEEFEELENQESGEDEAEATLKVEKPETDLIEELEAKVAGLEDERLRDLAEFQNIQRRLEREKSQSIAYAQEGFARDLLSVIDSLDNAQVAMADIEDESIEKLKEGIDLTIDQFKKIFEKHGVELIEIDGGFDPNYHEAMMKVDSEEHEEGAIVQVFQKGYKIKSRLLRSAMVSVAK